MPKVSATRLSCSRAIANGFSRRCETAACVVAKTTPFEGRCAGEYTGGSLDRERRLGDARPPRKARHSGDADAVSALSEWVSGGASSGETEGVAPRQQVAKRG